MTHAIDFPSLQIQLENDELTAKGEPIPTQLPPLKNVRIVDKYRQSDEFRRYEALCRGEDVLVSVSVLRRVDSSYSRSGKIWQKSALSAKLGPSSIGGFCSVLTNQLVGDN